MNLVSLQALLKGLKEAKVWEALWVGSFLEEGLMNPACRWEERPSCAAMAFPVPSSPPHWHEKGYSQGG